MSHFHSATVVNVVDEYQISNKINGIVIKRGAWQCLQTVYIEECWFSGIFLPFLGLYLAISIVRISTHDGTQQY